MIEENVGICFIQIFPLTASGMQKKKKPTGIVMLKQQYLK